ncbi:6-bladed beta-propeller, partial [bacterium]|nr:6-bladed beta-propeller [bacterium]
PVSIEVDEAGNVYVLEYGNHRVQVFDSNGNFLWKFGGYGSGDGRLYYPVDMALDGAGNFYVADFGRIQVFDSNGTFLGKWGSYGTGDGQINYPNGITVDGAGNVYVTQNRNNNRHGSVQVFDSNGNFLRKLGSLGAGDGQLYFPHGIAVDGAGNVYVSEWGNNRIQVFDSNGTFLAKWGSYGAGDGQFKDPMDIEIDEYGNIYVADAFNHRIQVFEGFAANSPPVADAGPDQTVECAYSSGSNVTLDGSLSSDPDGDTLTYDWTGAFGSITGVSPLVTLPYGSNIVTLTVTDPSAESSTDTVGITVLDTIAPATSTVMDGSTGDNGWYVSDLTYTLMATDNCIGVSEIHYVLDGVETVVSGDTAAFTVSADGTHTLANYSVDVAGNAEAMNGPVSFKIDQTPPDIVITGIEGNATYALGLVPTAGYLASDSTSSLFSSSDELTGGDSIGLGRFTYTVTAVDYAGTEASATASYTVIATTQGTTALIDQFISTGDIGDPGKLHDYLSDAQAFIDSGNFDQAIQKLDQFKQGVDKDRDKEEISEEAAVILVGAADAMISDLQGMGPS